MSKRDPIEGVVARVLNSREVAINVGSDAGVEFGMIFEILDTSGDDIEDPISGEILGSVHRPKVQVRVNHIKEKFALAKTFKTKMVNVGGNFDSGIGLSDFLRPRRYVKESETFRSEDAAWEAIHESDSIVKTGDPVRELLDESSPSMPESSQDRSET